LAELGEVGYGAFTIESVAARAGVGKSTIYRHYHDRVTLIAAAFQTLHTAAAPALRLDQGSVRERVGRILRHMADVVVSSAFSRSIPALIDAAERDPDLRAFHHGFQAAARRPLVELLAAGRAAGELPARLDPELAAQALLGAIFFRRLMTAAPLAPEEVARLLETVLG